MRFEQVILKSLIYDEEYTRKVLPFIKAEYFTNKQERLIFEEIESFILKYNNNPTFEALLIQVSEKPLVEDEYSETVKLLEEVNSTKNEKSDPDWLLQKTEKFCQDQAIYLGVVESVDILNGKKKDLDKGAIPKILEEALQVSFNHNIGHDYITDADNRFEQYHLKEDRIPFDIEYLNKITNGGIPNGTITLFVAGTGVGKSLVKCHLAAHYLSIGKNVLYITLEMSEIAISQRIDANLLDIEMNKLESISKEDFMRKLNKLKTKSIGRLIVKQFPTAGANVLHFQHLLNELRLKKNFNCDVLIVDYLNICASSRLKMGSNINSYLYVKAIAEELRGLAISNNIPVISSTQFSRGGNNNSDPNIEDISESFGTAMTADLLLGIIRTEELDQLNQILFKQIKNRFNDLNFHKRFVVGVDRGRMKLYDLEESAQSTIMGEVNVRPVKNKFEGIKITSKSEYDALEFD